MTDYLAALLAAQTRLTQTLTEVTAALDAGVEDSAVRSTDLDLLAAQASLALAVTAARTPAPRPHNSMGIVAFTVLHAGETPTPAEYAAALAKRLHDLQGNPREWVEAVELTDTMEPGDW